MRRTPLKRRYKAKINQIGSEAWHKHAESKGCVKCGAFSRRPGFIQGHHVITKQTLQTHCKMVAFEVNGDWESAYGGVVWDLRNCLPLCERCHAQHHSRYRVLPLGLVREHCPKIDQFARELGLEWWLEKTYG